MVGTTASHEKYEMFLRQHHDSPKTQIQNADYCDVLMNHRHDLQSCKPFNIFIHTSEAHLREVCRAGGQPYHGSGKYRSRAYYPVSLCKLGMKTRAQECIYYTIFTARRLVVSCDKSGLPVQLDEVLTMSA